MTYAAQWGIASTALYEQTCTFIGVLFRQTPRTFTHLMHTQQQLKKKTFSGFAAEKSFNCTRIGMALITNNARPRSILLMSSSDLEERVSC